MTLASVSCADTNRGNLPPGVGLYPTNGSQAPNNGNGGVKFHILPYIDMAPVYKVSLSNPDPDGRNGNNPTYSQWNGTVQNTIVPAYQCPSDPTNSNQQQGRTSYVHNGQIFRHHYQWGN